MYPTRKDDVSAILYDFITDSNAAFLAATSHISKFHSFYSSQ